MLDPFRHPFSALQSLLNPIGTCSDKFRVAKFRHRALSGSIPDVFNRPETSTLEYLKNSGFSASMIERFFARSSVECFGPGIEDVQSNG